MPPLLTLGGRADTDAPGGYAAVWQVAELPPEVQSRLRPNWLPSELQGEESRAEAARVVIKVLSPLNASTRLRTSDPDTARRGIQSDANSLADLFKPGVVPSAIPEPSTWVMMGLGFAGLAGAAGYRRRLSIAIKPAVAR